MLTESAQGLIADFPLGFVATITPGGQPALSPKGTFLVLDHLTVGFGNIRSSGTLANLRHNPYAEVNFIDQWKRKGLRLRGPARIAEEGTSEFIALIGLWQEVWGDLAGRITDLVLIDVEYTSELTTPPYDDGVTEDEMIAAYKRKFAKIYP
ncbi:pyridoxamine 5'-phosphate oxidase family protein [Pelagivirga sediminicola]|uniref:Pyridoxamine 5'-phosphate oxidase family protein n=1 Tax=Pelagivirga sediminicola TaxID=2170575 RepID=A0A2T7G5S7_9RHOB|nr:pyridoxamine 5'-phosphate oxidase family protein [Pelagivirga sediminicola]PVA09773.1 pyridoxamine 5'-phosphate oxidase family protein [Pelagivirga sediminicola]